jgi:beta-mannanase
MNGDWVPWNGDPTTLRAAWRHIATLFHHEGAHNVRWVFSPNVTDEPRTDTNRMERYYPGHDVVDVLALDGYNWGTTRPWSHWTPFHDLFRAGYDRIAQLGPHPIWFAELASAETGGDKAAWVTDMFHTAPHAFPRLQALIWFDEHKEADWRITSTPTVTDAFRHGLTPPNPTPTDTTARDTPTPTP